MANIRASPKRPHPYPSSIRELTVPQAHALENQLNQAVSDYLVFETEMV